MKKPSAFARKRARSTLFGRLLRRLVGEDAGAVMMEYVIMGVLVAAAAVAMVVLFGKEIRNGFQKMIDALMGKSDKIVAVQDVTDAEMENAQGTGDTIAGQE